MALATTMSSCPKTSSRIGDTSLLLLNNRLRRADRLQTREDDAATAVVVAVAASAAGLAGQFAAAAELAGLADTSAASSSADDVRSFALTVAGRTLPQSRKRRRADRKQVTAAIRAAMKSTMTMDLKSEGAKGGAAATSLSGSAVASGSSSTGPSSGMGSGGTAVTPGHGHGQHGHGAVAGDGAGSGGGSSAGGVVTSAAGGGGLQRDCAGCKKRISERYMLKALDLFWHEDCLKCACCDCRLGEVGSTLFTKANLMLCKRDYLRLFGTTGYCSACSKMIPAFEMVMRARGNVYHLECFACQQCNHRFCVGDRFYLCENKILCEYDYEERMVFANMPYNYNSIAHIKRQTHNLNPAVLNDNDGSSGYGSPDSLTFDGK